MKQNRSIIKLLLGRWADGYASPLKQCNSLGILHKIYRTKIMSKLQFHIINGWMKMQGTSIRLYEIHRQRATNEKAFMWLGIAPVCSLYSCSHTYASHRIRFRFFSMFIVLDACNFFSVFKRTDNERTKKHQ